MATPDDPARRSTLLLWGFMASGKSTVGRQVADRSRSDFWDLDECIEGATGMPLARLFEQQGEPHFRSLERGQVERALAAAQAPSHRLVVALGGGALLDEPLLLRALAETFVVTLTATVATVVARARAAMGATPTAAGRGRRPLLPSTQVEQAVAHLLKQRAGAYQRAHATISTENRSPDEVCELVLARWRGSRSRS